MSEPFTIRVFVADGDAESVHIVDGLNWTDHRSAGLGAVIRVRTWRRAHLRSLRKLVTGNERLC